VNRIVIAIYRISHVLREWGVPFLPLCFCGLNRLVFCCMIAPGARIGKRLILGYGGLGVMVHDRAVIGDDCVLSSGVGIGGRSKLWGVPVIGNRVVISIGAKVLGPVNIGDEAVIGANAVVVHDVPPRTVVGGIPARVLTRDIDIRDYHNALPLGSVGDELEELEERASAPQTPTAPAHSGL
jgi:serine O-acetyltransferase